MLKPEILYTYEPPQPCRLESILNDKLYLSKPGSFNDVSECSCQIESIDKSNIPRERLVSAILSIYDKPFNEVKHNILLDEFIHNSMIKILKNEVMGTQHDVLKKIIARVAGTLMKCFIPLGNNSVMWSHYGNNYSGILIEYSCEPLFLNYQSFFIKSMSYKNERPSFSLIDALFKPDLVFEKLLLTKQADWSYERERRLCIFDGSEYLDARPGKLIDMPKRLKVRSVTFGTRCVFEYILKYARELINKNIDCYFLEGFTTPRKLTEASLMNNGEELKKMIDLIYPANYILGIQRNY